MTRILGAVGACLMLVAGLLMGAASPAAAADGSLLTHNDHGCNGARLMHKPMRNSFGQTIAYLDVYYESGGWNCAFLRKAGPAYGDNSLTLVEIRRCSQTSPGGTCSQTRYDSDAGYYSYYAGPVSVYSPNNCVQAAGQMKWAGRTYYVNSGGAKFCN